MYTPKGELNEELIKLCTQTDFLQREIVDAGLKTPEACYEAAKRHLPEISFEDFTGSMAVMHQYVTELQNGLLTEEDLDAVAGGKMDSVSAAILGTGGATAVLAAILIAASV